MPKRSPTEVRAAVRAVYPEAPSGLPEWRWWRWMWPLPGDRLAFVADDQAGWERLVREGQLLGRLSGHIPVSQVVAVSEPGWIQVRQMAGADGRSGFVVEELVFERPRKVPSVERYRPDFSIGARGERLAADLGRAVAAVQAAVTADEARRWGFPETDYLQILDRVAARLSAVPDLGDLRAAVPPLRAWFAGLPADPVLATGDLQMHNLAMSDVDGRLLALFDFDDAAVAHRLEDFKYLPSMGLRFVRIALDSYAEAGGRRLSLAEVWRFHVLSALEHFLFVPEEAPRWAEIVDWTRRALEAMPVTSAD